MNGIGKMNTIRPKFYKNPDNNPKYLDTLENETTFM